MGYTQELYLINKPMLTLEKQAYLFYEPIYYKNLTCIEV